MPDAGAIDNFPGNSTLFKFQQKIMSITIAGGTKDVEIMVPLKYYGDFWRTLGKCFITCEINLILTSSDKYVLSNHTKATIFAITNTELYDPVVTLSTQDNTKLLQQLKSDFKRTINCNKYKSKASIRASNPYLDLLIDPRFQGVNRLFALSFENDRIADKDDRKVHTKYYLPTKEFVIIVEIKNYKVVIKKHNFFINQLETI